jgi:hypothetical protein
MSQNLELPDPIFDALQQAASAKGTTPVGWIAAHLPSRDEPVSADGARTLADLFVGHLGGISSGGKETLSENCGEQFAEYVEQKRREGHL